MRSTSLFATGSVLTSKVVTHKLRSDYEHMNLSFSFVPDENFLPMNKETPILQIRQGRWGENGVLLYLWVQRNLDGTVEFNCGENLDYSPRPPKQPSDLRTKKGTTYYSNLMTGGAVHVFFYYSKRDNVWFVEIRLPVENNNVLHFTRSLRSNPGSLDYIPVNFIFGYKTRKLDDKLGDTVGTCFRNAIFREFNSDDTIGAGNTYVDEDILQLPAYVCESDDSPEPPADPEPEPPIDQDEPTDPPVTGLFEHQIIEGGHITVVLLRLPSGDIVSYAGTAGGITQSLITDAVEVSDSEGGGE